MDIEIRKQQLSHKAFIMMLHILWVVGIPAAGVFFAGRWLDTTYAMRPYGSVIASIVSLVISWTLLIYMYKRISNEYRLLKEEEQKQQEQKRQERKDKKVNQ